MWNCQWHLWKEVQKPGDSWCYHTRECMTYRLIQQFDKCHISDQSWPSAFCIQRWLKAMEHLDDLDAPISYQDAEGKEAAWDKIFWHSELRRQTSSCGSHIIAPLVRCSRRWRFLVSPCEVYWSTVRSRGSCVQLYREGSFSWLCWFKFAKTLMARNMSLLQCFDSFELLLTLERSLKLWSELAWIFKAGHASCLQRNWCAALGRHPFVASICKVAFKPRSCIINKTNWYKIMYVYYYIYIHLICLACSASC